MTARRLLSPTGGPCKGGVSSGEQVVAAESISGKPSRFSNQNQISILRLNRHYPVNWSKDSGIYPGAYSFCNAPYNPTLQLKMGLGPFQAGHVKQIRLDWLGVTMPAHVGFIQRFFTGFAFCWVFSHPFQLNSSDMCYRRYAPSAHIGAS